MLKKLIYTGIRPEYSFGLQNKIRIFNTSFIVIFFINLFYIIVGIFTPVFYPNLISIFYGIILLLIFFLIRAGKHNIAFHLMMIFGIIFLFIISVIFGEKVEAHAYLLFIPLASVILFDRRKCILNYFLFAMAVMIAAKFIFSYYEPIFQNPIANQFGMLNLLFTGILLYIGLMRFKNENLTFTEKINQHKILIEAKNKDITDSINYAQRIQNAILPSEKIWKEKLPDSFILYLPKDIIAGDFYWLAEKNDWLYIAAADSTGHGVPGAMVSVVCANAINNALKEIVGNETGKLLDLTREIVIEQLSKNNKEVKDGMDISIIAIKNEKIKIKNGEEARQSKIQWSGANSSLWYINSGNVPNPVRVEVQEIKGDRQPIGSSYEGLSFTTHTLQIADNRSPITFYLFTDGFGDQFGGERNKKYSKKKLKNLLLQIHHLSLAEQKEKLLKHFLEWKGNGERTDDVTVIGIRV